MAACLSFTTPSPTGCRTATQEIAVAWAEAGQVAVVAVFLASDAFSHITGAHISIDCGLSLAWPQVFPA